MAKIPTHDVIIVGGGAAGLSAGLVLARAQADVLIIDSGHPRNAPAHQMHGFLSRDGMDPKGFLEAGRREFVSYNGAIIHSTVSQAAGQAGSFRLTLDDGSAETTRAILVATGLSDDLSLVPGMHERWGTLVHHCPYCHGYEVSSQRISVIGGQAREMSIKQAGLLRRYSDAVTFVTNDIQLEQAERNRLEAIGVRIIEGLVTHLNGAFGTLTSIALSDGSVVDSDAVFIAPTQHPHDTLLRALGCSVSDVSGLVTTDGFGQTSVPGVWAAGNVVSPTAQVITAAGAGGASAIAINGWLLHHDIDAAVAARN
ncbi:hypothetical protein A20C1_10915 [marine actinobacterium PHSC20C1]|nr:hypothetical protein A20C1_10915 [marine actinobacterium PHSC20C1]